MSTCGTFNSNRLWLHAVSWTFDEQADLRRSKAVRVVGILLYCLLVAHPISLMATPPRNEEVHCRIPSSVHTLHWK